MNKHQVKGRMDEMAGKAQKNLGKALDSTEHTAKGMAREQKGKLEKTYGDAKDEVQSDRDSGSTPERDRGRS